MLVGPSVVIAKTALVRNLLHYLTTHIASCVKCAEKD